MFNALLIIIIVSYVLIVGIYILLSIATLKGKNYDTYGLIVYIFLFLILIIVLGNI